MDETILINEEVDEVTLIIEDNDIVLEEVEDDVVVIEASGDQGPAGAPGTNYLSLIAGENIDGYQVVVLIGGLLYKADPTNASHAPYVVGLSTNSALAGSVVIVAQAGLVSGGSFTIGQLYYAGENGAISTSYRGAGFAWGKPIGVGEDTDSIVISLGITTLF